MRKGLHQENRMSKVDFIHLYLQTAKNLYSNGIKKHKYYYQSVISAQEANKGAYKVGYNSLQTSKISNTVKNMTSKVTKFGSRKKSNKIKQEEYVRLNYYLGKISLKHEKEAMKCLQIKILN